MYQVMYCIHQQFPCLHVFIHIYKDDQIPGNIVIYHYWGASITHFTNPMGCFYIMILSHLDTRYCWGVRMILHPCILHCGISYTGKVALYQSHPQNPGLWMDRIMSQQLSMASTFITFVLPSDAVYSNSKAVALCIGIGNLLGLLLGLYSNAWWCWSQPYFT